MCFRDMTFCNAKCANTECSRKLTEEVEDAAEKWWGVDKDGAPIAVSDFSHDCKEFKTVSVPSKDTQT